MAEIYIMIYIYLLLASVSKSQLHTSCRKSGVWTAECVFCCDLERVQGLSAFNNNEEEWDFRRSWLGLGKHSWQVQYAILSWVSAVSCFHLIQSLALKYPVWVLIKKLLNITPAYVV